MPKYVDKGEALNWVFYDSLTLDASAVDATLFQSPVGQSNKTLQDTNMRAAGKLPASQEFEVKALGFLADPDVASADIVALLKGASFELVVGEKRYHECPLILLTGGCGIDGLTTGTSIEHYHNGIADPRAIYTIEPSVIIEEDENFRAEVHWDTAPGAKRFMILLFGMLKRSIQ